MRPIWQILTHAAESPNSVLACDECFAALDAARLADWLDAGGDPKTLWHAAQRHLARCPDCREHHRQRIHELEARLVERSQSRP